MKVGDKLRSARKAAGFSQDALAKSSGVSQSAIARFESGNTVDPGIQDMQRIATVLNLPLHFFVSVDEGVSESVLQSGARPKIEVRIDSIEKTGLEALETARAALALARQLASERSGPRNNEDVKGDSECSV